MSWWFLIPFDLKDLPKYSIYINVHHMLHKIQLCFISLCGKRQFQQALSFLKYLHHVNPKVVKKTLLTFGFRQHHGNTSLCAKRYRAPKYVERSACHQLNALAWIRSNHWRSPHQCPIRDRQGYWTKPSHQFGRFVKQEFRQRSCQRQLRQSFPSWQAVLF